MNNKELKGIIEELLKQPEGLKFDFKVILHIAECTDKSKQDGFRSEFIRDILALVNGNIGTAGQTAYLIVGAADKLDSDGKRKLQDSSHICLTNKEILQKINSCCRPPIPDIQTEFVDVLGTQLFVICIPPTPYLHETTQDLKLPNGKVYPKNSVFIRHGEEINIASLDESDAIRREKYLFNSQSAQNNQTNWLDVCRKKLEKLKADSALRKKATAIGAEVNVYVPLDLLEQKEQIRSKQDKGNLDQRNQYQERKVLKTYEHDDFLGALTDRQSKNKHIAIVGEAGAGKTTLLARIADELDKNQKLQIFVSLADLRERSLEEHIYGNWLSKALGVHKDSINEEQKSDLFQQFQSGEIWLLLDGLDEMRAKSSADALEKINREIREVIGQSRVVLTSRLNVWDAYLNRLSGFDTFKMGDFSPEQVDKFISDWFVAAEKPESAPILQAKLKEPNRDRIRDMVRHPLRLALLCQAFYRDLNTELPETKVGLYELFVRYFYEWKPNIVDEDLTQDTLREELHLALGKLAIAGIDGDAGFRLSRSLAVKEMGDRLFKLASDVGWLTLIERDEQEQEVYAFYHASFQEYFAALAITDWDFFLPKDHVDEALKNDVGKYRRYRIFESIWQESLLLWIGRSSILEIQKVDFIGKITSFKDHCIDLYYYQLYFLIIQLYSEIKYIKSLSSQFESIIGQVITWRFGEYDPRNLSWNNPISLFYKKFEESLSNINSTKIIDILLHRLDIARDEILDYFRFNYQEFSKNKELLIISRRDLLENEDLRICNSLPDGIFSIIRTIKNLSNNNYLVANIAINMFFDQKYPYDYFIFSTMFPEIISINDRGVVKRIINGLLSKKNEYIITKNSYCLGDIGFLIHCLGKSEVFKDEIVSELTSIIKDPEYIRLHSSAAESILEIEPNNQFAIFEIIEPLIRLDSENNDILENISPVLEKFAVGNTQVIEFLSQVILDKPLTSNASFFAIDCLGSVVNNDKKIVDLLIDCLKKANDMEAYTLNIENEDEYLEEIEYLNDIVNNICCNLIDIVNRMSINHNVVEEIVSILMRFSHFASRLYLCECIESIAPNNPVVSDEIEVILGLGEHVFSFIECNSYKFKNLGKNQKFIDLWLKVITSFPDTIEKIKFVKVLKLFDSQVAIDYLSESVLSSRYIAYAEILSSIDLNNKLSVRKLFREFLYREIEDNNNLKGYRESILRHLISTLKDCNDMKQMVKVISSQKFKICDIELSDSRKDARLQSNLYALLWHCAQNMSYPEFYEAWHSQPTATHPEVTDTIPSNNTNKIQTLESQLMDCFTIQKELDRNANHPEIRCLVVDIRQLEQESDPNVIAKKLTNKIFNSIGRRIPVVQDVSCLERELLNLKFELGVEKLAITLYGKSANEAIHQLCQSLTDSIRIRPFTEGQTTQQLMAKINAWLSEM